MLLLNPLIKRADSTSRYRLRAILWLAACQRVERLRLVRSVTASADTSTCGRVASLVASGYIGSMCGVVLTLLDADEASSNEWISAVEIESADAASGVFAYGLRLMSADHAVTAIVQTKLLPCTTLG